MDLKTKSMIIRICAICAITGLAVCLFGDVGLIIAFMAFVLLLK